MLQNQTSHLEIWGTTFLDIWGTTGRSPAEDYKDDEGTGASLLRGEAEEAGLV